MNCTPAHVDNCCAHVYSRMNLYIAHESSIKDADAGDSQTV